MGGFARNGLISRIAHLAALGAGCLALTNCASNNEASRLAARHGDHIAAPHAVAVSAPSAPAGVRVARPVGQAPKPVAAGARQHALPKGAPYSAVGLASWYGAGFHGRRTADGETFDMNSLTAAHRTLPLPCNVRVTNLANRRSIVVRVNDRGPYAGRRVIDVSAQTAKLLGFYDHGLARVKVDYIGRAPLKISGAGTPTPITGSAAPL